MRLTPRNSVQRQCWPSVHRLTMGPISLWSSLNGTSSHQHFLKSHHPCPLLPSYRIFLNRITHAHCSLHTIGVHEELWESTAVVAPSVTWRTRKYPTPHNFTSCLQSRTILTCVGSPGGRGGTERQPTLQLHPTQKYRRQFHRRKICRRRAYRQTVWSRPRHPTNINKSRWSTPDCLGHLLSPLPSFIGENG